MFSGNADWSYVFFLLPFLSCFVVCQNNSQKMTNSLVRTTEMALTFSHQTFALFFFIFVFCSFPVLIDVWWQTTTTTTTTIIIRLFFFCFLQNWSCFLFAFLYAVICHCLIESDLTLIEIIAHLKYRKIKQIFKESRKEEIKKKIKRILNLKMKSKMKSNNCDLKEELFEWSTERVIGHFDLYCTECLVHFFLYHLLDSIPEALNF